MQIFSTKDAAALEKFELEDLFQDLFGPAEEHLEKEYNRKLAAIMKPDHTADDLEHFKNFMDNHMMARAWKRLATWVLNYEVVRIHLKSPDKPYPARVFLDPYPVDPSADVFQTPGFEPIFLKFLDFSEP